MKRWTSLILCTVVAGWLVGGAANPGQKHQELKKNETAYESSTLTVKSVDLQSDSKTAQKTFPSGIVGGFQINWSSVNGGGQIYGSSSSFMVGASVGQSVAGAGADTDLELGIGFWYGACQIAVPGDINLSGAITSSDVILLVNFVFKSGAPPMPCEANGDVNCSGAVTSSDVITLVNFVFKSGPPPCNTCTSALALSC